MAPPLITIVAKGAPTDIYARCTPDELRAFIKERTGEAASRGTSKYGLIKTLRALDSTAIFRFLDLPEDLRKDHYDEFLLFNDSLDKPLLPQILCVCKQIHREAKGILAMNFKKGMMLVKMSETKTATSITFGSTALVAPLRSPPNHILAELTRYPSIPPDVSRVVVYLQIQGEGDTLKLSSRRMRQEVYLLATRLCASNVRSILLRSRDSLSHDDDCSGILQCLLMSGVANVQVDVPGKPRKAIKAIQALHSATALHQWQEFEGELGDFMQTVERAGVGKAAKLLPRLMRANLPRLWNELNAGIDAQIRAACDRARVNLADRTWQALKQRADRILQERGELSSES